MPPEEILMDEKGGKVQIDVLEDWKRTNDCGSLRKVHIGRETILMGWVNRRRDMGKLIFIDLRDRSGITQVVFDSEHDESIHRKAGILRGEWVIAVKGEVVHRVEGQVNPDMATGEIEVRAKELKILNETGLLPFQVDGKIDASENLRLKYRYLELRRPNLLKNLVIRHKVALDIRNYLSKQGFLEVETPALTKSTPEGARDYLVPSRISKGHFYALPQSPQLFKQLLMIAGFDRYFQIVKCFRDEDLRADRQPEFTQVDLELSFTDEKGVMDVFEGLMVEIFAGIMDYTVSRPFKRISYRNAMDTYGTDRPDTRFGMELEDLTDIMKSSEFRGFSEAAVSGGVIKAINVKGGAASLSRKELDNLSDLVKDFDAKRVFWARIKSGDWQSPLSKFLSPDIKEAAESRMGAEEGDLVIFVADSASKANQALGHIRNKMGERLGLAKEDCYSFLWITEFPLLEYSSEEGRYVSVHHPFTSPVERDFAFIDKDPAMIRARSYDLVINGQEVGGGSVRIHDINLQNEIFRILGLEEKEAREKFGFFLEALNYGAPPHAGMALGFDRLVAIMAGAGSLRDVIAFPKTQRATCPVTGAPSPANRKQLAELGINLISS